MRFHFFISVLLLAAFCSQGGPSSSVHSNETLEDYLGPSTCELTWPTASSFIIHNVAVVDVAAMDMAATDATGDEGTIRRGQAVWVEDGRIREVGFENELVLAPEIPRMDGCGGFLMAGLADMHVHLSDADLPAYLDRGITTLRNLWGFPSLKTTIDRIDRGDLDGPFIYAISPGLDDVPEYWPYTQLVREPSEAASVVQRQKDDGWTTLKLYADLRRDVYDAIVLEAQKRKMEYGGHVSRHVGIHHALKSGHRFIEHLSGYEMVLNPNGSIGAFAWRTIDESLIPDLISETVSAGTWNSPTLAIFSLIARGDERIRKNRQQFVKALYDAGAPLLAGTDSGIGQTIPGESLLDELKEFEEAGIPRSHILRIATAEAARFLRQENEFGRVVTGLRADLIILSSNPLEDLDALEKPVAVIARGKRVR